MSHAKGNWQPSRPNINERTEYMFNNDLYSDVKFIVPKTVGESKIKREIPAHKFILSISSPVFEAMFHNVLAEPTDTIELPDCEYESLLELFRYMYSDEANLNGNNVMGVLYLANKYIVPALADICVTYLQEHVDSSNVFNVLPSALIYEEKELIEECWDVVDNQTEQALRSEAFKTIERSLLEAVVQRDSLAIKELNLFQAVNLWAAKECERQGLSTNGKVKRRILGESIVRGIRFPLIRQAEFARIVLVSEILTTQEVARFFKYYNYAQSASSLGFLDSKRTGFSDHRIYHCRRFRSLLDGRNRVNGGNNDRLLFRVDRDIIVHGVGLFGSDNNSYSITVELKESGQTFPEEVVSETVQCTYIPYKCDFYFGYELMFHAPIYVKKNTDYEFKASIHGPQSWVGRNGTAIIQYILPIARFTFTDVKDVSNATTTKEGQFPEILFSCIV
ncbi:hypothetical protein pdam_00020640 [Pocillopora damicornis]|uniref:BTB domain-containing protein n=1 Tax=Pocillopora damicornis TaxID=46731 RepID=A0A3M6UXU3_POCDA|nr:BTB/POZ domain-containing protein 6-like [Pocillopora damicornis]RMX58409.1 hypothetical protein pdam_00020640 [Pocillopora damicornis]